MLVACSDCHRQYDVGSLAAGSRVRCFCGQAMVVPEARPREVAMQHCSSCGGRLESAGTCPYCGAEPSLAERGLGDPCPECLARLVKGARFCSACGVAIKPESLIQGLSSIDCPRCAGKLLDCRSEERSFAQCGSCGGLWLAAEVFEGLLAERKNREGAPPSTRRDVPRTASLESDPRYVPCPVCGDLMNRKNFGTFSGVIVDWCHGHGFWFDDRELERVLEFAAAGGLEREKTLERERQRLADQRRASVDTTLPPELWLETKRTRRSGHWLGELLADLIVGGIHGSP